MCASPQKENGYTPIAHTILEALSTHVISPDEWRVLVVILRKTYGWDKKEDLISNSQFAGITGISRNHIPRIINKLVSRNIIYRVSPIQGTCVPHSGDAYIIKYGFQKDFDKWVRCPLNRGLSPKQVQGVPHSGPKVSPKQGNTNTSITKETIQKKVSLTDNEFLNSLKEKFTWIDFDQAMVKMDAWLMAKPGRKKTRRFIVNWLNRIEEPMQIKPKIVGDYRKARDVLKEQGFPDEAL